MKKVFIFQDQQNDYIDELKCALTQCKNDACQISLAQLSCDYITQNEIDVVISNGLPKEWYFTLKGMGIVTITFEDWSIYAKYADIVIDFKNESGNRNFCGANFSVCKNENFDFAETANLIIKLIWDSDFFGYPIAYVTSKHLTDAILNRIEKFIHRNKIKLVEYLCNCHDNESVRNAEKYGFHFTDIRLCFEKTLTQENPITLPNSIRFGSAVESDIPELRKISENLYRDSRYFFDGNFEVAKVHEFFQGWVEKAVRGQFDDVCFCLFENELPIGFCTIKYNKMQSASIGLFGFATKYQGQGLATKLLYITFNHLLLKGISNINVVTQGRNYPAQRLYQSVGFKTFSTELWYHKWLPY